MLVATQREFVGLLEGIREDHKSNPAGINNVVDVVMATVQGKQFESIDQFDVLTGLMVAFELVAAASMKDSPDERFIDPQKLAVLPRGIFSDEYPALTAEWHEGYIGTGPGPKL